MERAIDVAQYIFTEYRKISDESWKLSELSHKEISWRNSRKGIAKGQNGSRVIQLEDIRKDAEKVRPYDSIWDMYYDEFDDAEGI